MRIVLLLSFACCIFLVLQCSPKGQQLAATQHSSIDTLPLNQYYQLADTLAAAEAFPAAEAAIDTLKSLCLSGNHQPTAQRYAKRIEDMGMGYFKKGVYDFTAHCLLSAKQLYQFQEDTLSVAVDRMNHNLGIVYYYKNDRKTTIEYFYKSMEGKKKLYGPQSLEVSKVLNNLGVLLSDEGADKEALRNYTESHEIKTKLLSPMHPALVSTLLNISSLNVKQSDYKSALENLHTCLEIFSHHPIDSIPDAGKVYNNLAAIYSNRGDYARAIDYHKKAIALKKQEHGERHWQVAESYSNLAGVYVEHGMVEESLHLERMAYRIRLEQLGPEHPRIGASLLNFGNAYYMQDSLPLAIEYHQKATRHYEQFDPQNHYTLSTCYFNLGASHQKKKDYEAAIEAYSSGLEKALNMGGRINEQAAKVLNATGTTWMQLQQPDSALVAFNQSIEWASGKRPLPVASVELLFALIHKGKVYAHAKNAPALAAENFEKAEAVVRLLENKFMEASLPLLRNYSKQLSEERIRLAIGQQQEAHRAFEYSDGAHASLLRAHIQENYALQYAGLPAELLEKEYELRKDITYLARKLYEQISQSEDEMDTTTLAISSRLFDLNQSYDSLKRQLEENHPKYYGLKYDLSAISVKEVQDSLLEKDQALLEYFVGDSTIYVFIITNNSYEVKAIKHDFPLEAWVLELWKNISQPHTYTHARYSEVAYQLYQKLFAPIAKGLPERIVIVPDGMLGYVPFEALLTEPPEKVYEAQELPYLILNHQISYCYSAALLGDMRQKQHYSATDKQLLALAPFADVDTTIYASLLGQDFSEADSRNDSLSPLPFTRIELDQLKEIMPGATDALYGAEATEEAFLKMAEHYRMLHLSTHGKADYRSGDYSYLAFYPLEDSLENEFLYVRDLYNLPLNADLVTLSACETGIGKLQKGEGMISLSRAFAYAGAKSVVTTLWKVNDRSTQELMVGFYKILLEEEGISKDAALRNAKLDYLKAHSRKAAYPYYWAAMIGIGDMSALK
jgi:CHAT domain-containing protein